MNSSTASSLASACALAAALSLSTAPARAQTSDPQLAQSLFDQARDLMNAHRYKEACPLFAESQRLDPGGGTLLNLAVCHEGEHKAATAWTEFHTALSDAIKEGRKGRVELARQHIAALEPRLSHITVGVPQETLVDGLAVSLDGILLGRAAWGVAAAVDTGTHKVEATAPGRRGWSALVVMTQEGEARSIDVPALAPDGSVPAPPPPPIPTVTCPPDTDWNGRACVARAPAAPFPPVDFGPIRVASTSPVRVAVGVIGLAAFAGSLATGIVAWADHNTANDHCDFDRQYCDTGDAIAARSNAQTWAWVSTISLGTGILLSGAYLFWPKETRMPASPGAPTAARATGGPMVIVPVPMLGGAGLVVRGAL